LLIGEFINNLGANNDDGGCAVEPGEVGQDRSLRSLKSRGFANHTKSESRFRGEPLAAYSTDLFQRLAKKIGMKNVHESFEMLKTIVDNPTPGKLVDRLSGLRIAFVDSSFISYFLKSFADILGQRVSNRIIKEAHMVAGKHMVQIGKKMFGLKEADLAFAFYFWLFSAVGWGSLKELELDKETLSGSVKWEDYGGSLPFMEKSSPIHVNMAGEICGAAEEAWGQPFEVEEMSCAAQGKPYCEFKFNPRKGN
jgi:predicted hydrocarbon binding protein